MNSNMWSSVSLLHCYNVTLSLEPILHTYSHYLQYFAIFYNVGAKMKCVSVHNSQFTDSHYTCIFNSTFKDSRIQ